MQREMDAMEETIVGRNKPYQLELFYYPCIFMYKLKSSPGLIYDWKSRLFALGNLAKEGIHYQSDEISSSVLSYDSLRTVISLATGNNWDLH